MEIIKRTDLEKLTIEDIQKRLESDVVVFADQLKSETSEETLKALEDELMTVFKENDEYLKTVEYSLGSDTEYDGVKIKRSAVIDKIIYLINKIEVEFRATLGIYQAIKFWKGVVVMLFRMLCMMQRFDCLDCSNSKESLNVLTF